MQDNNLSKLKKKHLKKKYLKILSIIFLIIVICSLGYYLYNLQLSNKNKMMYTNIPIKTKEPDLPINIQKVKTLKSENNEVIGWIQIEDSLIDYPILQNADNNYYLKYNYKNEKSKYGSIFAKNECNISDSNSNLILYGHNMKDSQMFGDLLKYENIDFYNNHKVIKIATDKEESNYNIISVFKSRVFYNDESNVFRYYDYTSFENPDEYNDFINNCKKSQLYDTGVSAEFGEKIITLITCEYSQENGRFVVVAKKI